MKLEKIRIPGTAQFFEYSLKVVEFLLVFELTLDWIVGTFHMSE